MHPIGFADGDDEHLLTRDTRGQLQAEPHLGMNCAFTIETKQMINGNGNFDLDPSKTNKASHPRATDTDDSREGAIEAANVMSDIPGREALLAQAHSGRELDTRSGEPVCHKTTGGDFLNFTKSVDPISFPIFVTANVTVHASPLAAFPDEMLSLPRATTRNDKPAAKKCADSQENGSHSLSKLNGSAFQRGSVLSQSRVELKRINGLKDPSTNETAVAPAESQSEYLAVDPLAVAICCELLEK